MTHRADFLLIEIRTMRGVLLCNIVDTTVRDTIFTLLALYAFHSKPTPLLNEALLIFTS